jgi:hypothetical protein
MRVHLFRPLYLYFTLLSVLLLSNEMRSETPTYNDFHPQSVISLGRGFSVEDLTKAKQSCVTFEPDPLGPTVID